MGPDQPRTTRPGGLNDAEVADRVLSGQTNATELRTSRTVGEIVRANMFTFFNALLLVLFVMTMATGRWQNGFFGLIVVANAAIGITQEVRAKRTLDRLAVLTGQRAEVVRSGMTNEIAVADIVLDDLVTLSTGDQVPADGVVVAADALEIDESLLTGESDPVLKRPDDEVRSGSVVVAGHGRFQATAVGPHAYATRLAEDARRFSIVKSELVAGTNRILRWIGLLMLVVGPLFLWSQFSSKDNDGWRDAVTGTAAGLVGMVPEGLVLLTSLAFTLATISLARQKVLVRELPAVEGLARVDVLCLDKTGTLTYGEVAFDHVEEFAGSSSVDIRHALGLLSGGDERSVTTAAVGAVFSSSDWRRTSGVAFSSARKWAAVNASGHGAWVLGAPEMVLSSPASGLQRQARDQADERAAEGHRVLLLAHAQGRQLPVGGADGSSEPVALPPDLVPAALVVLVERVREDAAQTLRYFAEQGVAVKVISGDNPRTVAAVARAVGVVGADEPVDARGLPATVEELADAVDGHSVFGRVTPQQKRAMVSALQHRGHVVAMTGDGVNDSLALKEADIGIAMGNGSPATRGVAQLILLDSQFSRLPGVVAEGRRVIANIERATNLFLVKNVYSLVLAVFTAVLVESYPLAPLQVTVISTLTVGIPGLALALAPSAQRYVPGFVPRVLRFSIPVGVVAGASAYLGYRLARTFSSTSDIEEGRAAAVIVILLVAFGTVVLLARPLTRWKTAMVGGLGGLAVAAIATPAVSRDVLSLGTSPSAVGTGIGVGLAGAAVTAVIAGRAARRAAPLRPAE
jgi:cation-transporting ATPase E